MSNKLKEVGKLFWRKDPAQSSPNFGPDAGKQFLESQLAPAPAPAADVNEEFYRAIDSGITKNMTVPFAEFWNQYSNISAKFSNLDKAMRFQLAFTAAQTALKNSGVLLTIKELVIGAETLLGALPGEQKVFDNDIGSTYAEKCLAVQKELSTATTNLGTTTTKIAEMESNLKQLRGEKQRLETVQATKQAELQALEKQKSERSEQFAGALKAHADALQTLIDDMKSNIK